MAKKVEKEVEIVEENVEETPVKSSVKADNEENTVSNSKVMLDHDKKTRELMDEVLKQLTLDEQFRIKVGKPYRHLFAIRKQVERLILTHKKTSR